MWGGLLLSSHATIGAVSLAANACKHRLWRHLVSVTKAQGLLRDLGRENRLFLGLPNLCVCALKAQSFQCKRLGLIHFLYLARLLSAIKAIPPLAHTPKILSFLYREGFCFSRIIFLGLRVGLIQFKWLGWMWDSKQHCFNGKGCAFKRYMRFPHLIVLFRLSVTEQKDKTSVPRFTEEVTGHEWFVTEAIRGIWAAVRSQYLDDDKTDLNYQQRKGTKERT